MQRHTPSAALRSRSERELGMAELVGSLATGTGISDLRWCPRAKHKLKRGEEDCWMCSRTCIGLACQALHPASPPVLSVRGLIGVAMMSTSHLTSSKPRSQEARRPRGPVAEVLPSWWHGSCASHGSRCPPAHRPPSISARQLQGESLKLRNEGTRCKDAEKWQFKAGDKEPEPPERLKGRPLRPLAVARAPAARPPPPRSTTAH